ncbi:MAG: queuosine precursor transporter [Rickettsiales bacterium]|nr:queuosine precursor transporter [Rickettsiales bacterium]MCA0254003.1 queuosine precursor transporter [Pseudomonadota bacterium]
MIEQELQKTKYYTFLTLIFIFCLLISNLAEIKIFDFFGLAQIGGGTIFFPLLYVLNDIITEVYGFSASRRTIWLALFFNILFTALMQLVILLPDGADWNEKQAFETVFLLSPRIMVGSLISYFIGELVNSTIISSLKLRMHGQMFPLRAVLSTFISSFIESVLFGIIAFYGRIPDDELVKMTIMLTLLKVLYEIVIMPFTVIFVSYLKKTEKLDVYEKPSLKKILPSW